MGGGNGAKSKQARERAQKEAAGGPKSQLKQNEAAMNKKCSICMQPFLQTANKKALDEHASSKHNKTGKECFGDAAYDASK